MNIPDQGGRSVLPALISSSFSSSILFSPALSRLLFEACVVVGASARS